MAFLTQGRDLRGQFERYSEDGSENVNPSNPNENLRGGASRSPLVQKPFDFKYNALNSRTTDLERFMKFLGTPSGLKMQGNIAILQQSGRDLKATFERNKLVGGTAVGNILRAAKEVVLDTIKGNVGFTATLAKQIPVNGTGTHYINNLNGPAYLRQGGDPKSALGRFLKDTLALPDSIFGFKLNSNPEGVGTVQSQFVYKDQGGKLEAVNSKYDTNTSADIDENEQQRLLDQKLKAALKSVPNPLNKKPKAPSLPGNTDGPFILDENGEPEIPFDDFFKKSRYTRIEPELVVRPDGKNRKFPGLGEVKKDQSVYEIGGLGDSADKSRPYTVSAANLENRLGYRDDAGDYSDLLGTYGPQYKTNIDLSLEEEESLKDIFKKQIIPFSFSSLTPEASNTLFFRAFLEDLSDNYSGNWNPQQYVGRGEQFYTYQGFTRQISFSFKVAAFNEKSLDPIYKNLNLLAGTTAPNYSEQGNFMRGTMTRISIGDYLYRQSGFINSVNLTWNKSYSWEIDAYDEGEVDKLPHVLDVQIQFTPIHNFNVKSDLNLENEKYIGRRITPRPEATTANEITPSGIKPIKIEPKGGNIPLKKTIKDNPVEKVKKRIKKQTESIPLTITEPVLTTDLSIPGVYAKTDQSNPTFGGIGTSEERKTGRAAGYFSNNVRTD